MTQLHMAKKSIGATLLALTLTLALLVLSGQAKAIFVFLDNNATFTGTVTQVSSSSIKIDKGGTYPFVVVLNDSSVYEGGFTSGLDIEIGDFVEISTREDQGMLLAERVELLPLISTGYGASCDPFSANELWVSSVDSGVLVLSRAHITFNVQYDANTNVLPGAQAISDITVGETVSVEGTDCLGDGIKANTIIRGYTPPTIGSLSCGDYGGIVIMNSQHLLSHDIGGAYTPFQNVAIPSGSYDVYGLSFDNHEANDWDTLGNERWFVEGKNNSSTVYTSGTTDDLPNGVARNATKIGNNVHISELSQVRFVHAAFPDSSYQSILPECVVFMPSGVALDSPF